MNVLQLAWIGVRRRPLASALTAVYVGLGAALVLLVAAVKESTARTFADVAHGYDLLLAPQNGAGLTAVLSTLFYVDRPVGTLPYAALERAERDPRVKAAVPYALGDTFRGHRVVGTTARHFEVLTDASGRALGDGLTGRLFGPEAFEAVVGSQVARESGVGLGSVIQATHGLTASPHVHRETWTVVGVLRPTGTPQDRAVFIPLPTFYAIEGHTEQPAAPGAGGHDGHDAHDAHDEHDGRRLTGIGVRLTTPFLRLQLFGELRRDGQGVQPVLPADEVRTLLDDVVGPVEAAFRWLAGLVVLVGALGILVGLYNTLQGRRREIAVLRALGARPGHVFVVLLLEAVLLCLLGGLLGLVLGHLAVVLLAPGALAQYGVRLSADPGWLDLQVLAGLAVLGALVGLLPAWRGLRTPVAANLGGVEA